MRHMTCPNFAFIAFIIILLLLLPTKDLGPIGFVSSLLILAGFLANMDPDPPTINGLLLVPCFLVPCIDTPDLLYSLTGPTVVLALSLHADHRGTWEQIKSFKKLKLGDFITLALTPTLLYLAIWVPQALLTAVFLNCAWWTPNTENPFTASEEEIHIAGNSLRVGS